MGSMTDQCGAACNEPCRSVVTRTYKEMRALGADDPSAFSSAVKVMALRHPRDHPDAVLAQVAEWLDEDE
jgi:hypothetical protein